MTDEPLDPAVDYPEGCRCPDCHRPIDMTQHSSCASHLDWWGVCGRCFKREAGCDCCDD